MSWKEKTNNYLEEQRRIEEVEEKARVERSLQQEAFLKKKIVEYQEKALPLINALNKTPIKHWLEEIKKEEDRFQNASICLFPNSDMEYIPEDLYAEVKLARIWEEEHNVIVGNPDNSQYEDRTFRCEISIGVGVRYDEQKIQFYSVYNNSESYPYPHENTNICLNNDPECKQKIEKALVRELIRLNGENK